MGCTMPGRTDFSLRSTIYPLPGSPASVCCSLGWSTLCLMLDVHAVTTWRDFFIPAVSFGISLYGMEPTCDPNW